MVDISTYCQNIKKEYKKLSSVDTSNIEKCNICLDILIIYYKYLFIPSDIKNLIHSILSSGINCAETREIILPRMNKIQDFDIKKNIISNVYINPDNTYFNSDDYNFIFMTFVGDEYKILRDSIAEKLFLNAMNQHLSFYTKREMATYLNNYGYNEFATKLQESAKEDIIIIAERNEKLKNKFTPGYR